MVFSNKDEVKLAFESKIISLNTMVKVRFDGKINDTTVGRIVFNEFLPEDSPFINTTVNTGIMKGIVADLYRKKGCQITV